MPDTAAEIVDATELAWRRDHPDIDARANAVFLRLAVLSRKLAAFHDRILKPEGIPTSDYRLLMQLWLLGPSSPKRLNGFLAMTSAGLTNLLDRLEGRRLIRRRADPKDGRAVLVEITAAGAREAERLGRIELDAQAVALAGLGAPQRKQLSAALDELIARL